LKAEPDILGIAHYKVAEIYNKQHKPTQASAEYEQAAVAFQQAIRLKPRDPDNYLGLGRTYVAQSRKDAALQVYRALQRIDPKSAQQLLNEINKH